MRLMRFKVWKILTALIRAIKTDTKEYWMEPIISKNLSEDMDEPSRIDSMLTELLSGRLSQRIAEAATLAAARHMYQEAQEMQSLVEAEYSTT